MIGCKVGIGSATSDLGELRIVGAGGWCPISPKRPLGCEPGSYLFGRVFTTKLARLHAIRPAFAPLIPCSRALNRGRRSD